jgi:hypothetical protein
MIRALRFGALAGLLFAAGCTSWSGYSEPEDMVKRFSFEANNFKITKTDLKGHSSCAYIFPFLSVGAFGMGGIALGSTDLYAQAYKELRANAQPFIEGKSAQLHNVVQEISINPNFYFYGVIHVNLAADVVEFTGEYVDYKTR